MGRGLSDEQESIIRFIGEKLIEYRETVNRLEASIQGDPNDRANFDVSLQISFLKLDLLFGARWESGARSGSDRASASRALRRLEKRGLVTRNSVTSADSPHTRTTHAQLTPKGWEVFKRLTGKSGIE